MIRCCSFSSELRLRHAKDGKKEIRRASSYQEAHITFLAPVEGVAFFFSFSFLPVSFATIKELTTNTGLMTYVIRACSSLGTGRNVFIPMTNRQGLGCLDWVLRKILGRLPTYNKYPDLLFFVYHYCFSEKYIRNTGLRVNLLQLFVLKEGICKTSRNV